ncbi:alpha-(1,3)-fucosyltransferase 7 [Thalassophryne amazonica]|uniref:alpha-(1,3)-fucosyltransferase 7 n=1 Tax=Thalassophryne amazonica TaxID=390379 RepID=UPI001471929B|nr:alpha-(1,3)-fucosyltransferase 7 [Thalassophryne amazonica]
MTAFGSRVLLLAPILLLLCLSSFVLYAGFLEQTFSPNKPPTDAPQRNITILLWHWPFGRSYGLSGDKCLEMYNISHCFLTDNRLAFSAADVVVFHHTELSRGWSSLPVHLTRPPSQHWVWLSLEPPVNNMNLIRFNGFFNWTMTYRRDADIPVPYGLTLPGGEGHHYTPPENRSCLISWVVSRYLPDQARARVYQSLKKHVHIEVYGKWSNKPLSHNNLLPTISRCLFYLAFENSEATDYITEKLWRNSFQAGVVPVVLGPSRTTYEALAPPGSFIHVADFKSTAHLAAYLKSLSSDRQAYEAYLHWHRTHKIKTYTDWRERLCQICVRYPTLPPNKVYEDLQGWVYR